MPSARVKRILANRQSAARSKERKLAYISELEGQVRGDSCHSSLMFGVGTVLSYAGPLA